MALVVPQQQTAGVVIKLNTFWGSVLCVRFMFLLPCSLQEQLVGCVLLWVRYGLQPWSKFSLQLPQQHKRRFVYHTMVTMIPCEF
jgi:hypothetical protein